MHGRAPRSCELLYLFNLNLFSRPTACLWQGLRGELLNATTVSLAPDALAVIDRSNTRTIRCFDTQQGKPLANPVRNSGAEGPRREYGGVVAGDGGPFCERHILWLASFAMSRPHAVCAFLAACALQVEHTLEVVALALSQAGPSTERKLVFIDRNRDLYITPLVRHPSNFAFLGAFEFLDLAIRAIRASTAARSCSPAPRLERSCAPACSSWAPWWTARCGTRAPTCWQR